MTSPVPHPDHALRPGEPLAESIIRILGNQFDHIERSLVEAPGGIDVGVHSTRKSIKRIRAVLRLVREGIGRDTYRLLNRGLRDAARHLSPARDSFVLIETIDDVTAATDLPISGLRGWLVERHESERRSVVEGDTVRLVAHDLWIVRGLSEAAAGTLSGESTEALPPPLLDGLQRTYARGRRAFDAAHTRHPDALHEWRKRVKYLRHQCEALELIAPDAMSDRIPRLDELGEMLGSHHDRAVLLEVAAVAPESATAADDLEALMSAVQAEEEALADRALGGGTDLYAMTPAEFITDVKKAPGDCPGPSVHRTDRA